MATNLPTNLTAGQAGHVGHTNIVHDAINTLGANYAGLAQVVSDVTTARTTNGAATTGRHNPVDATAGVVTVTLPASPVAGSTLAIEKADSSTNVVTISGNIRGAASTVNLVWQRETIVFTAKSDGSWWPVAGHKTKSSLDTAYQAVGVWPTGSTITVDKVKNGNVWPDARPTAQTDVCVIWKGNTDPGTLAIDGDEWKITA